MKRIPTAVFSEWAEIGRDELMAKGHEVAVNNMLEYALKDKKKFSFIDAGCGNGWVVRLVKARKGCVAASGVDGAQMMIEKALSIDPFILNTREEFYEIQIKPIRRRCSISCN